MTTVACVWVDGNVPYPAEYVVRLRSMVARYISRVHSFICLTDRPLQLPSDMDTVHIPAPVGMPGWWSKLRLFREFYCDGTPDRTMLYLDLDSIVVAPLDEVLDYAAPFALIPDAGTFQPRTQHKVIKRFNSSVMKWSGREAQDSLYNAWDDWSPEIANRLWGDQDYLAERVDRGLLKAKTMPLEWFPRVSALTEAGPDSRAKVVLCKKPKNELAARQYAWVAEAWQ